MAIIDRDLLNFRNFLLVGVVAVLLVVSAQLAFSALNQPQGE